MLGLIFFFHVPATTESYTYRHTLSLHDALPISPWGVLWRTLGALLLGAVAAVAVATTVIALGRDDQRRPPDTIELTPRPGDDLADPDPPTSRSEEHTSELQSLMRISYAVFCLKKKNRQQAEQQCNRRHQT